MRKAGAWGVWVIGGGLAIGLGCSLNPHGQGTSAAASLGDPDTGAITGDEGSATAVVDGTAGSGSHDSTPTSGPGSTSDVPGSTSTPGSTGPSSSSGSTGVSGEESSGGGGFDCQNDTFDQIQFADDAVDVIFPMFTGTAWGGLPGSPEVGFSGASNFGWISFAVNVPCDDTYVLWGLVWDRWAGVSSCTAGASNADSYAISVDGGSESTWIYGCSTCSEPNASWTWQRVDSWVSSGCQTNPFEMVLSAGVHEITLRNLEGGNVLEIPPNVAAIAAIAISNDGAYDPENDYPP